MRSLIISVSAAVLFLASTLVTFGQAVEESSQKGQGTVAEAAPAPNGDKVSTPAPEQKTEPETWLLFVGGKRLQVDEVEESADGFWYKRGSISTFVERARVKKVDRIDPSESTTPDESVHSSGSWRISNVAVIERFFFTKFGRRLPLTTLGQSELHTRWGLDHRQGIDVSLHPDSPEGRALIGFLRDEGVPFQAFRYAIPRVATGPHIHIGNPSPRISGR